MLNFFLSKNIFVKNFICNTISSFVQSQVNPLIYLSIDTPEISSWGMRVTFMARLWAHIMKKSKSVSDLIVVKSLRWRIDLNFDMIIFRQLKCSAHYFDCGKVNNFGILKIFKICDFKRIYSRKNKKWDGDLRTKN